MQVVEAVGLARVAPCEAVRAHVEAVNWEGDHRVQFPPRDALRREPLQVDREYGWQRPELDALAHLAVLLAPRAIPRVVCVEFFILREEVEALCERERPRGTRGRARHKRRRLHRLRRLLYRRARVPTRRAAPRLQRCEVPFKNDVMHRQAFRALAKCHLAVVSDTRFVRMRADIGRARVVELPRRKSFFLLWHALTALRALCSGGVGRVGSHCAACARLRLCLV
mmetsp:Transcript_14152/g.27615  ORF Transcript_14152/g.27615 Transcript_14152/m.27615 type:complete len:225 (-) Transcript_14152:98-772(-)